MRKAKVDRNQPLAVAALRTLSFLVHPTHTLGQEAPDFIVLGATRDSTGDVPQLVWVELKCGKGKLTPGQVAWHKVWGQHPVVIVVSTVAEILKAFRWTDSEIAYALDRLPFAPSVQTALRAVTKRDGLVSDEIMATIEFEQVLNG